MKKDTLKKKEFLSQATTWTSHEVIVLNEISQSQKDEYYRIPLPKIAKFKETESRAEPARGCGEEKRGVSVQ